MTTKKTYSAKFKFRAVLELLEGDKKQVEVARAYDIHPVTLSNWKSQFLEKGPEVFGDNDTVAEYEKRISELEKLLGKKELKIALYQNFLNRD